MNTLYKTEFLVPDTRHPSRSRSVLPASAADSRSVVSTVQGWSLWKVSERKKMFEQDRGSSGGRGSNDRDLLLPPSGAGQDQTDHSDKHSGKRRHSTKERFSTRGSSFRAKKLRQEVSTGDLGSTATSHYSPQTRHKQQASVTSIVLPPLWSRLRNFGHHDLQSATMERFGTGKNSGGVERSMRKKPTGASAAHAGVAPQEAGLETLQNELLAVCPAFRNEIGGDADWAGAQPRNNDGANLLISLRRSLSHDKHKRVCSRAKMVLEGTIPSKEIMEHKSPMNRQVLQILQPQTSLHFPFEFIDVGALYYRNHFYQHDHQNFFGVDDSNGPIAISLRRERVPDELANYFDITSSLTGPQAPPPKHQYRVLVRTSELETLRGIILEDSIPSGTKTGTSRGLPPRDVIDYISQGEFHVGCLKVAKQEKKVYQELMRLDEQELSNRYKVGILYCKPGQINEEDMYNNEKGSEAFEEFLQTIGHKVALKGFTKYRAQLDNKTDITGTHSVYTEHQGTEIMFHVSTYLPHTPSNKQQLLRKRHIGNDIVTVIFQEPNCSPFSPKVIRSHFQHIFIIVQVENPGTDYTKYKVSVSRSQDIPYFGPPIPEGGVFDRNEQFKEFFLTKLINACNASLRSEKFATMATRTRRQYLLDLCENSSTSVTIEQANASGLVGLLSKNWGGKKREKTHLHGPLVYTPGALVWNAAILMKEGKPLPFSEEYDSVLECIMVISADLMVFVYSSTRDIVLHIPMRDISGWIQEGKRINLFYDGSYCVSLEVNEVEDVRDITCRLLALGPCLSASHEATLMEFQRGPNDLLGFLINEVGEVHRVSGQAKQIGLQMKSRILQVEDRLVCTHKHSQITEILTDRRKSLVKAYVIPPLPTIFRSIMYYPSVNWQEIWANRPTHMNGESEDQTTQNGTEPMDMFESNSGSGGGSVAFRGKRKAATIHGPHTTNRTSYHEAMRLDEIGQLAAQEDEEPIYDKLRSTENQSIQANVPGPQRTRIPNPQRARSPTSQRARSPKPPRDNIGFTRVRSRATGGGRDHMPAQQIAENIRATERARSAGPSPEPLEHSLDYYTSHVPTQISNSTFLPNSQPHTTAPLSSLRRKNDKVMIEIIDPKSPPTSSIGVCPPTPGSVHELAKKFSFSSPPQSNRSSPSRTAGSTFGTVKSQSTPMKATMATSEMTRTGIPIPSRPHPSPGNKFSPSPDNNVQMRSSRQQRSPKIRPASCDASLIFNSEREDKRQELLASKEEGEGGRRGEGGKQFTRKENGRLPVRKEQGDMVGGEEVTGGEEDEGEEPIPNATERGKLSQEELRRISVRERAQKWEARGSDLPSFYTLPKSFRTKGGSGRPSSPQSPLSPSTPGSGSRIPTPGRSSNSPHTALTQSLKARNIYSKQSTPPIQEETDAAEQEDEVHNRLSERQDVVDREATSPGPVGEVKLGSFVSGRGGVVSQRKAGSRGNRSSSNTRSQVTSPNRQMSPVRAISPTRKITVNSSRSPSPNSTGGGSKIPTPSSRKFSDSNRPSRKSTNSPPPRGTQILSSSRTPRGGGHPLDEVVLESGLSSLHLSTKETANRKVEDWLARQSSSTATVAMDTTQSPGKHDSMVGRENSYRKSVHTRSVVKTAMI